MFLLVANRLPARLLAAAWLAGAVPVAAAADESPPPQTQAEAAADVLAAVRRLATEFSDNPATVVAEIGGHAITRGDVADALRAIPATDGGSTLDVIYHTTVQGLMAQQAMVIRARQMGIDKDPAVQRRIAASADVILANEYLRRSVAPSVSEQSLHDAYNQEFAGKPGEQEVQARVIMTRTQQEAEEVLAALAKGADFAALAQSASKDASARAGGELGFVRPEAISPAIGGALFALAPGQTTAYPVRVAPNAWFIIRVEARRQQGAPDFQVVRDHLAQQAMRTGVPGAIQKAVAGLPAHDYGMTGKPAAPTH
jgi:peptidyl-prolyl cis-trans isomerase C